MTKTERDSTGKNIEQGGKRTQKALADGTIIHYLYNQEKLGSILKYFSKIFVFSFICRFVIHPVVYGHVPLD